MHPQVGSINDRTRAIRNVICRKVKIYSAVDFSKPGMTGAAEAGVTGLQRTPINTKDMNTYEAIVFFILSFMLLNQLIFGLFEIYVISRFRLGVGPIGLRLRSLYRFLILS